MSERGGDGRGEQPIFDPRHDSIYQRGYVHGSSEHDEQSGLAGRSVRRSAPSASPSHAAAQSPAQVTGPSAATGRPMSRTVVPGAAARNGSVSAEHIDDEAFDYDHPDDEIDSVVERRANPYLSALWLVGIVMIVAGLGLYWQAVTDDGQSYSSESRMSLSLIVLRLSWTVAPTLVSTGLLVLVGLVFERAISWQRARR